MCKKKTIDKLFVSGLHNSGKSTFISSLSDMHANTIRLDVIDIVTKQDTFDFDMYFKMFNIYDRFFFVDGPVYFRFDELLFDTFYKNNSKALKNSLFIVLLFKFNEPMTAKEQFDIELYSKVVQILKKYGLHVKVFTDKEKWIKFSSKFKDNYQINYDKVIDIKYADNEIVSENCKEYIDIFHNYYGDIFNQFVDESDVKSYFDYQRYLMCKSGRYVPKNVDTTEKLRKYFRLNKIEDKHVTNK